MIKKYKAFHEGKKEEEMLDQLLDKGVKNITPKEKELLTHLSKGGKLEEVKPKTNGEDTIGTGYGTDTGVLDKPVLPPKPKSKFVEGDKITYIKAGSPHDGKSGIFLKVREDGKYSLRFDDNSRFAANPKNVFAYNKDLKDLDPYDEEDWNNKGNVNHHFVHPNNPNDPWFNGGNNPYDEYSMINLNNVPSDFYFHAQNFNGDVIVCMTTVAFFDANHGLDDSLGSHALSDEVKHAMTLAGVYSQAESSESMWEGLPGFSAEDINTNMEQAGFNHSQAFIDMLNQFGG